jgi:hypothetical protein
MACYGDSFFFTSIDKCYSHRDLEGLLLEIGAVVLLSLFPSRFVSPEISPGTQISFVHETAVTGVLRDGELAHYFGRCHNRSDPSPQMLPPQR